MSERKPKEYLSDEDIMDYHRETVATESERSELRFTLQAIALWIGKYDAANATIATLTAERDRLSRICDELLAHCDKEGGECSRCGEIVCDHNEPLHFHHDGCPACSMDEPSQLKEQPND